MVGVGTQGRRLKCLELAIKIAVVTDEQARRGVVRWTPEKIVAAAEQFDQWVNTFPRNGA